jgi:hypothetical protein
MLYRRLGKIRQRGSAAFGWSRMAFASQPDKVAEIAGCSRINSDKTA